MSTKREEEAPSHSQFIPDPREIDLLFALEQPTCPFGPFREDVECGTPMDAVVVGYKISGLRSFGCPTSPSSDRS